MRYYISIQDLGKFLMVMPLSTKYRKYLFIIEPVQVDGISVIPRHLLHVVLEPQILARPGEQDLVIIRIIARGLKDGQSLHTPLAPTAFDELF